MQQIGFAAATSAGLKTSGALTNADIQVLTHWYLANMSAAVQSAGTPAEVLLTHYGGTLVARAGAAPTMPYAAGELPGVALGLSLYVTPLGEIPSFAAAAQRTEGWGAVEFGLGQFWTPKGMKSGSVDAWHAAINVTMVLPNCKLISQVPLTPTVVAAAWQYVRSCN